MNLNEFKAQPIMGILRDIDEVLIEPLIDAIVASGLKTIEIAMNTPNAANLISKCVDIAKDKLIIGAGTVLTVDNLKSALDSGASFIVSPTLINEVLDYCVKASIPAFPGALTPQEIYNAYKRGASMVKVFPANRFGPDYFKEIRGPFKDIPLLACGGIRPNNIKSYFDAGASAVAFGGSIFNKEMIKNNDFKSIKQAIKDLILAK